MGWQETLAGGYLPKSEPRVATGNTVATFKGYPSLPSDDSGSEVEMEGPSDQVTNSMAEMKEQFKMLLAKQEVTKKELADIKKKDTDQAFARTCAETATQDPIRRVVALLEAPKQENSQEYYVRLLKAERAAGRATLMTFSELSKAEAAYKKKL